MKWTFTIKSKKRIKAEENKFSIESIEITDEDIMQSKFYNWFIKECEKFIEDWKNEVNGEFNYLKGQYSDEAIKHANDYLKSIAEMTIEDMNEWSYPEYDGYASKLAVKYIKDLINGLKKLAQSGQEHIPGNFGNFGNYFKRDMKTAQDVIAAADDSVESVGYRGYFYNNSNELNNMFYENLRENMNESELSEEVRTIIKENY